MSKKKRWHANSMESRLHFATPYVAVYESWLRNQAYTASTIEERVRLLAGWTHWMHASGSLRANDDETSTYREFTLEGRGHDIQWLCPF